MEAGVIWRRRIVDPLLDLLRQGITPVIGSTSILCFLAAILLGLNAPAIQLANYLAFLRMGQWTFAAPPVTVSADRIFQLIRADVWGAIATLWTATLQAEAR